MYNAMGNLAANGFAMWIGLVPGVLLGLWLLYKEMEHISWGGGGSWAFISRGSRSASKARAIGL